LAIKEMIATHFKIQRKNDNTENKTNFETTWPVKRQSLLFHEKELDNILVLAKVPCMSCFSTLYLMRKIGTQDPQIASQDNLDNDDDENLDSEVEEYDNADTADAYGDGPQVFNGDYQYGDQQGSYDYVLGGGYQFDPGYQYEYGSEGMYGDGNTYYGDGNAYYGDVGFMPQHGEWFVSQHGGYGNHEVGEEYLEESYEDTTVHDERQGDDII